MQNLTLKFRIRIRILDPDPYGTVKYRTVKYRTVLYRTASYSKPTLSVNVGLSCPRKLNQSREHVIFRVADSFISDTVSRVQQVGTASY